jgi:hypothetical protein
MTEEWEIPEETGEVDPSVFFFEGYSFSKKTGLSASYSKWDFDADFHNENPYVFNLFAGKVWDEWHIVSYNPIKSRVLGAG